MRSTEPGPGAPAFGGAVSSRSLERFRAKWIPVRVKKTRQNKNLEPGSDSIRTGKALAVNHGAAGLLPGIDATLDMGGVGEACVPGGGHRHRRAFAERAEEHHA